MENNQLSSIKHLLENVSVISKKYNEIAQITGENFNIFSIMSMETDERYTHSAIISELLNPKGSHGQGSIFLKLFFEEIECLESITEFNFENAKITTEKYIGTVNTDEKTGGYIDLIIADANNTIIIENKIYASDQLAQLERYKNHYKQSILLYLNLFGYDPSEKSKGALIVNQDFHLITYKNHIKNWLEKCHKETVNQPILRETIKQYLNLIKKLTNQTVSNDMSKEIKNILLKDLKSAKEIIDNFQGAKAIILNQIRNKVKIELEKTFGNKYYFFEDHNNADEKNSHIWFNLKEFEEHDKKMTCFGLEPFSGYGNSGHDLFIGILDFEKSNEILFKQNFPDMKTNGWWKAIKKISDFEAHPINFSDINFLQLLYNDPMKLQEVVQHIVDQTGGYIKQYEDSLIRILSQKRAKEHTSNQSL